MSYSVRWEKKGVLVVFDGHVSADDITRAKNNISGHENFDQMKYQLVDLTGVLAFDFSEEKAREFAVLDKAALHNQRYQKHIIRIAYVTLDEYTANLLKAYQRELSGSRIICQIFSSFEKARDWLELYNNTRSD